ncbi:DUF3396 domain-containing protein, partial [Myxococcus sp. QH3KD-4-1]
LLHQVLVDQSFNLRFQRRSGFRLHPPRVAHRDDGLNTTPERLQWIDLNEQEWSFVREKLLKRRAPLLLLHDTEDALYQYRFEYCGKPPDAAMAPEAHRPVCAVRCWLPTEYLEQHGPDEVRGLALKLASLLPFCSGHAGLAFNGELDVVGMMAKVREVCFRYPGLDLLELMHVSWEIGTRVRGPAWLTFLGQPALAGLGGVSALREQLHAPGTTVEALPETAPSSPWARGPKPVTP